MNSSIPHHSKASFNQHHQHFSTTASKPSEPEWSSVSKLSKWMRENQTLEQARQAAQLERCLKLSKELDKIKGEATKVLGNEQLWNMLIRLCPENTDLFQIKHSLIDKHFNGRNHCARRINSILRLIAKYQLIYEQYTKLQSICFSNLISE